MFKLLNRLTKSSSSSLASSTMRVVSAASRLRSCCYSTQQSVGDHVQDMMSTTTNPRLSYATSSSSVPMMPYRVQDFVHMQADKIPNSMLYGFPHQGVNLTFGEVRQRVQAMAQQMANIGLVKGDRIALALPNCHELVIAFLAAAELGLISVIMNPAYQAVEFEYMLKKTNAKALFIYDTFKILNHIQMINKICPELESSRPGELNSKLLPDLKHIVVLNSPLSPEKKTYKGTYQFDQLSKPASQSVNLQLPYIDLEDPCVIMFSSGTTGRPKGAVLTHQGLVMGAYVPTVVCGKPAGLNMICQPIPIFHIMGLVTGVLISLTMGTPIVFPFYFPDTLTTMKSIQAYKCVTIRGTPTQYIDLINHPERKNYDLSSLENAIMGGAPVPLDLVQKMKEILGIKAFIIGYGMTETSCNHSLTTHADKHLRTERQMYESLGRPIPFTETKIVDVGTGQTVPHETDGELYVRGPHIVKKYWDEEEQTRESFDQNGWFKTGDICSMDSEGFLYYKSRSKDLIIRGGANLYPAEIESYLRTHPDVVDAQVFGVPDKRVGEEICAWIRLKPEAKVDETAIKAYCKDNISHFKIPRYVKFVDAYPINANNKVLKRVMRDAAIKELKLDQ